MKLFLTFWLSLVYLPLFGQWDSLLIFSPELSRQVEVITFDPSPEKPKTYYYYFTDGRKWLSGVGKDSLLLLKEDHTALIFVSSLDQDTPNLDHREEDFFCNPDYVAFFQHTLIPRVEQSFAKATHLPDRILVGVSFGGLNAAFFSAQSNSPFSGFALLSPITYPCPEVMTKVMLSEGPQQDIFLSTGVFDAEKYAQPLASIYTGKGHRVKLLETTGHHDFTNWLGQLRAVRFFFESTRP